MKTGKSPMMERKKALNLTETRQLLKHLKARRDVRSLQERAVVLLLLGSGLRAADFCALAWHDLEHDEDTGT